MLKLYYVPISFNSRRVWIALREKGLEFEPIRMNLDGDQFQSDFLALNPFHHIPVLIDGDITVIESLAILDYLEAKYPNPSLIPQQPSDLAVVKMVEMVTVNELLPPMRPFIQQAMGLATIAEAEIVASQQKISIVLDFLTKLLDDRPYFASDSLNLADIVAGTIVPLLPKLGVSLTNYPQLSAWCDRLTQRPSWQETEATEADIEAFKTTMKKLMR